MKEKSELLQQTFWAIRDGFAIFDQKGVLVSCNKEFVQIVEPGIISPLFKVFDNWWIYWSLEARKYMAPIKR
ncbi:hypothetical protein ACE4RU_10560 [Actinobacillus seminis]|uniref:hypothetical protein n=1 Tax=Actinobacillus seminis TaxID=722 RepID=UPI003B9311BE